MTEPSYDHRISIAQEYFRRADAGRADIVELMTEDVQLYFPKYGIGHGKKAFVEFATGMGGVFAEVQHDFRDYHFMSADRHLIVEGTTRGTMKNGKSWSAGGMVCEKKCAPWLPPNTSSSRRPDASGGT